MERYSIRIKTMAVRSLSPSSFAFNDSNYDNENANAGSRSHLCLKKSVERRPRLLAKNDNSNGIGRETDDSN